MEKDMPDNAITPDKQPADSLPATNIAPATDSSTDAKANPGPVKSGFGAGFRNRLNIMKGKAQTVGHFCKEVWDEHDLWVEALAVKGGLSAIVIAGIVGVSSIVALPFMAAAAVIAGCGALIGVGIYGCAAGGARAWDSIRGVYARIMGREPPEKKHVEKRDMIERLKETKFIKKALEHRLAQKFFSSRAWKVTEKFTRKREDSFLQGMAVGGALVTLALGVSVLATQVLVLPVVAIGSLATWAVAEVGLCFASGIYGMYLSGQSILKKHREKRLAKQTELERPLKLDAPPAPEEPKSKQEKPVPATDLSAAFADKAKTANDNETPGDAVATPAAKKPPAPPQP